MRNKIFDDSQIRAQKEMVGFLYCAELSGPAEIQTDPAYERLWQYLLIVDRGEVEFRFASQTRKAGPRSLVSIPINEELLGLHFSDNFHGWCLGVDFNTLIEFFRREEFFPGPFRKHFREFLLFENVDNCRILTKDCRELLNRMCPDGHNYPYNLNYALFSVIMADIADYMERNLPFEEAPKKTVRGEEILYSFMRLCGQHIEEHSSINWYADKLCISPSYLSATIRTQTGIAAGRVLSTIRYERAIKYVNRSSMSLQEIADKMHFPDLPTFSRFFKRHNGRSPQAHRKMVRK